MIELDNKIQKLQESIQEEISQVNDLLKLKATTLQFIANVRNYSLEEFREQLNWLVDLSNEAPNVEMWDYVLEDDSWIPESEVYREISAIVTESCGREPDFYDYELNDSLIFNYRYDISPKVAFFIDYNVEDDTWSKMFFYEHRLVDDIVNISREDIKLPTGSDIERLEDRVKRGNFAF